MLSKVLDAVDFTDDLRSFRGHLPLTETSAASGCILCRTASFASVLSPVVSVDGLATFNGLDFQQFENLNGVFSSFLVEHLVFFFDFKPKQALQY